MIQQVFQKRLPPEAVDLVCRFFQYSPNLRCTAVSLITITLVALVKVFLMLTSLFFFFFLSVLVVSSPFPFVLRYFSWKPAFTLSLMNWGTLILGFLMAALFLPCLILNPRVSLFKYWYSYIIYLSGWLFFFFGNNCGVSVSVSSFILMCKYSWKSFGQQ